MLDTHFVDTLKVLSLKEIGSYLDVACSDRVQRFEYKLCGTCTLFVVACDIKCRRVCAGAGRIVL